MLTTKCPVMGILCALVLLSGCQARLLVPNETGATVVDGVYSSNTIGSTDPSVTVLTYTPASGAAISSVLIDLGVDFTPTNICSGKTIFGRSGTATCGGGSTFNALTGSGIHRDAATTQLTIAGEISAGSLPAGYREVPQIAIDDDGYTGGSVTYVARPTTPCGTPQSTIADRIADCNYTWNGDTQGNAGQGSWSLVTYDGTYEVWRDDRTQLLWSDRLLGTANWCRASGNAEATDPSNFCNNATYQDQTTPESRCAEGAGLDTPATYDAQKGGMRAATTPAVRWRLPTKYDWQQADNNGIRFVLPNMANIFSSASVSSGARSSAWIFGGDNGAVLIGVRSNPFVVRCVGR